MKDAPVATVCVLEWGWRKGEWGGGEGSRCGGGGGGGGGGSGGGGWLKNDSAHTRRNYTCPLGSPSVP